MILSVNIIGAGNLGKTIAYLLNKYQLVKLNCICNNSPQSAEAAIKFIGAGNACFPIETLSEADITFITTPDDAIEATAIRLSKHNNIKEGSIIVHCSGLLTSDTLSSLKEKGCHVASIHPMRSFAKPEVSIQSYKGTFCGIEGDNAAVATISTLFQAMDFVVYEIDKEKKALYHAAGVWASNYLVTLSEHAHSSLESAGVDSDMAMNVVISLMQSTLDNLKETKSPVKALTGPIKRGDVNTIQQHMNAIQEPHQKHLYAMLGQSTLSLTTHEGDALLAMQNLFNS